MKKRLISLLLAFSMMLTFLPAGAVSAFAEETADDTTKGTLLSDGTAAAVTRPWLFVFPAFVLIILLFAISLVGDALRDAIDPTSGMNRD